MSDIKTYTMAQIFIKRIYSVHGIPASIVSDRGPQFIRQLWTVICKMLDIKRRLSTEYHPQTDDLIKRLNAEIETAIRLFAESYENKWADNLHHVQLVLNERTSTITDISLYFMTHRFHLTPFSLRSEPRDSISLTSRSPL